MPGGAEVAGSFARAPASPPRQYPGLVWTPAAPEAGWQMAEVDLVALARSVRVVSGQPARRVRYSRASSAVAVSATTQSVTPESAIGFPDGINPYPDGTMLYVEFSEPVVDDGHVHDHVRVLDVAGCVAWRAPYPGPPPAPPTELIGSINFQCPAPTTLAAIRVDIDGGIAAGGGATVQSTYGLASPTDVVRLTLHSGPAAGQWAADETELLRLAGIAR